MNKRIDRGFTLVELLIVIVVVVILALVTATIYSNVQTQARDTQIRDAADKIADAIQLFMAKNGHFPIGGQGSSSGISGTECANGAGMWFESGAHPCTLEDTLVKSGYLPSEFSRNLPKNTYYTTAGTNNYAIMVFNNATLSNFLVYYTAEDPTSADTTNFDAQLSKCGINPKDILPQKATYGMRGAICVEY